MRYRLPKWRKHCNRIKHTSKICQRSENKIRNDRCRIKTICKDTVQKPNESKQERSKHSYQECNSHRSKGNLRKEKRNRKNNGTRCHATNHPSRNIPRNNDRIRCGWHQNLFNRLLEFCHIDRWDHMRKWIHNHTHHHESRHNKRHIIHSTHFSDACTNKLSENHIIECCRDNRRNKCLFPDTQKSHDFLANNRRVSDKQFMCIHGWEYIEFDMEYKIFMSQIWWRECLRESSESQNIFMRESENICNTKLRIFFLRIVIQYSIEHLPLRTFYKKFFQSSAFWLNSTNLIFFRLDDLNCVIESIFVWYLDIYTSLSVFRYIWT